MRRYSNRRGRIVRCTLNANVRGQIWIETVIYTLIGLAVIGLVLAGALPKINEKKDELIIGRSIEALGNIDDKIYGVLSASGNRRVVNLEVKSGSLIIDTAQDTISWVIDSSFEYSEVDKAVPFGNLVVTTTKDGDYEVELKISYSVNLTYGGVDGVEKRFNVAPTPYLLVIENKGVDENGNILIDLSEA